MFEPLYYADRLHRVNPSGDVGIVTLWSPVDALKRQLEKLEPDIFDPERSRVAVVSNLYGDGMYAMFCNILFNPHIRHLVAVGEDLGLPTCREIESFLGLGLEETSMLGRKLKRIKGTERVFPANPEFDEDFLRSSLSFRYIGKLSLPRFAQNLSAYLDALPSNPSDATRPRLQVQIPSFSAGDYAYLPSEANAHQVLRRHPLDCWEELVVRCVRFGRPVTLPDGPRLELLNAKAVITEPVHEPAELLSRFGFQLDHFLEYQQRMLEPRLPQNISYTYGNRLRGYFRQPDSTADTLRTIIDGIRLNPETRRGCVALWDTSIDLSTVCLKTESGAPCLTTIFFRRTAGRLSLTATFRSHNLLTAWLENCYGLMAVQRYVADAVDMPIGPITVISHSLGIDPRNPRYEFACALADNWRRDAEVDRATGRKLLRQDPNGYFVVTVDPEQDRIVAEHRLGGMLIKRYSANRAVKIEREIIGDMAVSLVSHAMWLGRELASKEQILRSRRERSTERPGRLSDATSDEGRHD